MRVKRIAALGMAMIVLFTGCQKAPEDAVVKEKNLDKMIEQAKEGSDEPESIAEKYNTYKKEFSNEKLGVKVKANAKVEITKAEKMSIVRVKQKKITQEFLDKVKSVLNLNQTFYDGSVTNIRTKSEIEKEIGREKASLAELPKDDNYEVMKEEYENSLKELQEDYKKAPKTVEWNKYLSDGKIKSVKKLYDQDKNNEFYEWAEDMNKSGDIYYGITGKEEKDTIGLYVQNNEDRGNCFRFFKSKNVKKPFVCAAVVGVNNGNAIDTNHGMWPADRKPTNDDVDWELEEGDENSFYEYKNEPTTISESQAHQTAEQFLKDIGLTDYEYSNGGLYCEAFDWDDKNNESSKIGYRKVWYLHYLRNLEGVLVNNDFGFKHLEDYKGGKDFVKKEWTGESIDICINDSGIVTFNYNVPIEITETVVENAKMKKFANIQKNFEKMVTTVYAQNQDEEKNEVTINIDKVVLRYMRISEKDSFDTGLLVPVWDFLGTIKDKFGLYGRLNYDSDGTKEQSILTINAIDGTVIDKNLGY